MQVIPPSELITLIEIDRTQLEVKEKDGAHYCGVVSEIDEANGKLIFSFGWRADYDSDQNGWFSARTKDFPDLKVGKHLIRNIILHHDERITIHLRSEAAEITFHPAHTPLLKEREMENFEITPP